MIRDVKVAGAGAVLGCLLTVGAAALVWPHGETSVPSSGQAVPQVPAAPDVSDLPTSQLSPTDADESSSSGDNSMEDKGDEGEPSDAPTIAGAPAAGKGRLPDSSPVSCPKATTTVSDADGLQDALDEAKPGGVIELEGGTYTGEFSTEASGTAAEPIYLCGPKAAVLDGDGIEGGYVLHLDGATHWRLVGFTVTNGQKGVMADTTVSSVIQDLTVTKIGDEAIHLRNNSTDNVVLDNTVSDTGLRRDKFGEGVYIGTAVSNWCTYTDCRADRSDRNVVKGNTITGVSSEAIDAKEGTTGGVIIDNTFDGSKLSGADSWVDLKGNNWLVTGNTGTSSTKDGFQTHDILPGWGDHNVFSDNRAEVNGPGLGIALRPEQSNVVTCSNSVVGAAEGLSNIDCS